MVILKEQITSQSFKIIPRVNDADSIVITGIEGTNTVAFTPTYFSYYMVIAGIFALKEGQQYTFSVMKETDIVYKGKLFCTNQVIKDYTVNQSEYIQRVTTNEFKIYE